MPATKWSIRISRLLTEMRVSQTELAGIIGVDNITIWRWLKGGEPPSHITQTVVGALERIVAKARVEAFFRAMRAHGVRARTRQMLELIAFFSSDRRSWS